MHPQPFATLRVRPVEQVGLARASRASRFVSLPLLAASLCACVTEYPQRLAGPLLLPEESAPAPAPAEAPAATSQAVTVQRDSDPVWIRRPGERGDYPLAFYSKRERVPVGSLVRTGAGGRAEILWSPDATTLALFDEGRVTLGDTERDEPVLRFHSVTRALLVLTPEDRVELVGGPELVGDSLSTTGPILLESVPGSILRVTNQSKLLVRIRYRAEHLELGPGESIDLPILPHGAEPAEEGTDAQRVVLAGLSISFQGRVDRRDEEGIMSLTALEPTRVVGLGIEARLAEQETIRFSSLSPLPAPVPEAAPVVPDAQP
jgi:hypothetical protein